MSGCVPLDKQLTTYSNKRTLLFALLKINSFDELRPDSCNGTFFLNLLTSLLFNFPLINE